ncbi:MAG: GNAT family N-acetyltransferase [Rhizobiaceae bacterium]|jgi:ribosomal protein S18 acetylase RimI-like enzyme|nr:GNAT family N-acetyltransferase [Rhizobiaceae bacterium]
MKNQITVQNLETRSGLRLEVRPVGPADEEILADFFANVTPQDLRFRFLGGMREVSHERLMDMVRVDHVTKETFVATVEGGMTVAAVAMLACDAELERGEIAISVRSGFKHLGVGWEMLRHVVQSAKAMGVRSIECVESRENHEAIELEREQGFSAEADPEDPTFVILRQELRRA